MEITRRGKTIRLQAVPGLLPFGQSAAGRWRLLEDIVYRYGSALLEVTGARRVTAGQRLGSTGYRLQGIYLDYAESFPETAASRLQLVVSGANAIQIRLFSGLCTELQIQPQNSIHVVQTSTPENFLNGTVTCVVKVRDYSNKNRYGEDVFIMSCLHVLGMSEFNHPNFTLPAQVSYAGHSLALYDGICGLLADVLPPTYSLDVALARVNPDAKPLLKKMFPNPPVRFASNMETIRKHSEYFIHTPRGKIKAHFSRVYRGTSLSIPYPRETRLQKFPVYHRVVVESRADTQSGDSGSAVLSPDGKMLLGMHIAGSNKSDLAYMIPAYELFNTLSYARLLSSDRIRLTDNFN